ncbi:MAG: hypothetical protein DRP87_04165 [Spirochaetes bacterium]|nr:MAG: hypothetical protein DRP87_04165 [Spirochaetota bacterium]
MIILDVMFGTKDKTKGFDYAVKMRQDRQTAAIPILMITALNIKHPQFGFSDKKDGEYLRVDDFIDKPAKPEELLSKVERLLKQKVINWANWLETSS